MKINDDGDEIDRKTVTPSVKLRGMFFEKPDVTTGKRKATILIRITSWRRMKRSSRMVVHVQTTFFFFDCQY